MSEYKSYFRPAIDAMSGYTPGEQPVIPDLIKLNTNENPYPPSAKAMAMMGNTDFSMLRLYPNPTGDPLRDQIAEIYGLKRKNIILGNGSDDILTMMFRCFTDAQHPVAFVDPTYSLYPVLAEIQGAPCIKVPLNADFSLSDDLEAQASEANLFILTRPNAPTGNGFPLERVKQLCREFDGIILIDEAYADFSSDNCIELVNEFSNVVVSRTLSKSSSAAGVRLGFAMANEKLIDGLMKVRDSYNVCMLAQVAASAILGDREHLAECLVKIKSTRDRLSRELEKIGFEVVPSEANFVFAAPPDGDGEACFNYLRENAVIIRYFPGPVTGKYIRITVGADDQINRLLELLAAKYVSDSCKM
jgi:histidinol-phosphate aminotransferase